MREPEIHGIGWDYETDYYHIYASAGPLDGLFPGFTLTVPETPGNDSDIQSITDALRRIAARV